MTLLSNEMWIQFNSPTHGNTIREVSIGAKLARLCEGSSKMAAYGKDFLEALVAYRMALTPSACWSKERDE